MCQRMSVTESECDREGVCQRVSVTESECVRE